ncbi:hypothetical protein TNCT_260251, partial [Trichonephila clavata]
MNSLPTWLRRWGEASLGTKQSAPRDKLCGELCRLCRIYLTGGGRVARLVSLRSRDETDANRC